MDRPSREALSLYTPGIGGMAFLLGLGPVVNMLFSIIGLLFAIVAVLGAVFLVMARLRRRTGSITGTLLQLTIVGVFTFFAVFGVMWYFISYMPSQGAAMFNFQMIGTTPRSK